jgi:hypothetical protein
MTPLCTSFQDFKSQFLRLPETRTDGSRQTS